MVGAIVGLLRCRQVAWEAVIIFLVVGDEKYSAKIEMIGVALIDEGIWYNRARQST